MSELIDWLAMSDWLLMLLTFVLGFGGAALIRELAWAKKMSDDADDFLECIQVFEKLAPEDVSFSDWVKMPHRYTEHSTPADLMRNNQVRRVTTLVYADFGGDKLKASY